MHNRDTGRFAGFTCSEISAFNLDPTNGRIPAGMIGSKDELAGSQPSCLATWGAIAF